MDYTTLGRTGLRVSRMGLGCGGHSRLGMARGATTEQAAGVVRAALGMGINFIDTAESYGTEEAVGLGISGRDREDVVISTKASVRSESGWRTAEQLRECLEGSLRRLRTDYVDIYHLHGVRAEEYGHACEVLWPEMVKLRQAGKLRWVGITEAFGPDPAHAMLGPAVERDGALWDVVMVGHNVLNFSARSRVLPHTARQGIGTLCMFAVRRALSQPEALREVVAGLVRSGAVSADEVDGRDPLKFLVGNGVAGSVVEAAYRFCRYEPGIDVVLSGTGRVPHLRENANSVQGPPLPEEVLTRLDRVFGRVDSVSGN